jgi:tRNA (cmo5U34)-methyltransferase
MCYSPAMSHSVESHLQLQITEYDQLIRRFIPRYDEMLDEAVYLIRDAVGDAGKLVDLGIGTGALAERMIKAIPKAQIIGIDADAKMLEEAVRRLSPDRTELRLQDFFSELPTAQNAYFAALALHHIRNLSRKQALYQKIYDSLLPGGLFLNADAMFDETESSQKRKRWAAHLISAGFAEADAFYHLESWRKEDAYFGLETELELLRKAGFTDCDVAWRYGPMAVIVGKKRTWNI